MEMASTRAGASAFFMKKLYLCRPAEAKGCCGEGWHGISACASESRRLNTSPQTMHSRRHIGFVGRSPLVNIITNSLPTLSSLILSSLQPSQVASQGLRQQPPLAERNSHWTLSSGDRRSPLKCYAAWQRWSATFPCDDLGPPAGDQYPAALDRFDDPQVLPFS